MPTPTGFEPKSLKPPRRLAHQTPTDSHYLFLPRRPRACVYHRMPNPVRDFVKVGQHSSVLEVGRAKETISRQLTTHTGNKAARRAQEMGSM